jgi:hypothetical protein
MELLALVIVWPLLLLITGLVFISASNVSSVLIMFPLVVVLLVFLFRLNQQLGGTAEVKTELEDLDHARRGVIAFSIALLLPIFIKYMLAVSGNTLPIIILGLIFGFGSLVWGMFIKGNKVLSYANITGGGLVIIYLYFQLWSLGQLAQIVAAAFGLVFAIVVSVVKFREKLA